jgi:ABC-type multidrug transport system ATPase subunit
VPATISVRDLRKSYGDVTAAAGVTFEVGEGEFFGILGPNGAGKTTTLEIIEGLRKPDSGSVSTLGLPPWPRNPRLLPRIGVQLQASSFFERFRPDASADQVGKRGAQPVPRHVPRRCRRSGSCSGSPQWSA